MILIRKKMPFIRDVKATLPEWNLKSLHKDSQQGEPLLKYHIATAEDSMKLLHPFKKKITQRLAAKYTESITIWVTGKL